MDATKNILKTKLMSTTHNCAYTAIQSKQFYVDLLNNMMQISVRPILHIGEYSLVALQYRRIRYIGLRVSTETDAPTAITIDSNLTLHWQNVTTNEAGISIHVPAMLLVSDYPSRPAPYRLSTWRLWSDRHHLPPS